ncbi:16S rRNA (cytidine(1402)-2'-O)-methyltransferase [Aliifodinibius sp. S!AR15-10]|uniref:16S rRNA (cytidine(1402)-2'-O)-methyltransferase n=1 Tax=Aliifodinibius sp. S!AR15-10 TaxID=2950437 RepID=UPI00285940AD|nr:16S rRNA (cytidine(1402)-2'-O)-methyltransferase [Aliifodinibius sp. S!AR15-10]MDR8390357.1 16S rRNA (cytidine(1402)-2'-O)-methyltransferase [Aliifodinibius sp. S!AR15-10]
MATLYIVATPIGNLDDFSPRAVEVLKSVSYIACEDTRSSGILLKEYGIDTPTFSFHQHNEHQKVDYLVQLLDANQPVALISDAGMPGISDPGFLAVREAYQYGHKVTVIPGPDAATTAVVASGLPCDRYVYEGFLPHKKGRQKRLKQLSAEERTIIFYESPYRVIKLLEELNEHFDPGQWAAVCRELTKKFEEVVRGSLSELLTEFESRDELKGEFVIVVAPKGYDE